jgi:hypothetical protein
MQKKYPFIFLLLTWCLSGYSQKPGQESFWDNQPKLKEKIEKFTIIENYSIESEFGPKVGEIAPNLILHDRYGNKFNLYDELKSDRPILLIGANFSCSPFRNKANVIHDLYKNYSNILNIFIIYGLESHPASDTSIYFGAVKPGLRNKSDRILLDQPKRYEERIEILDQMDNYLSLPPPVLVDNPSNSFLKLFGPAPNNAYIIDSTKTILVKHQNFNHGETNIYEDIKSIFPNYNNSISYLTGNFEVKIETDTLINMKTGNNKIISLKLKNLDSLNSLTVDILRDQKLTADTWSTAMASTFCHPSSVSKILLHLKPLEEKRFDVYITAPETGTGSLNLSFRNRNDPSNKVQQQFIINVVKKMAKKRKR